jgi:hypothetical protein
LKNQSSRPKKTTITKTKTCIISPLHQLPQKNQSLEAQEHNTFAQEKKKNSTLFHHLRDSRTQHRKINHQFNNTDFKLKNKKYHSLNSNKLSKSLFEKLYKFFQHPSGKRAKTAELA